MGIAACRDLAEIRPEAIEDANSRKSIVVSDDGSAIALIKAIDSVAKTFAGSRTKLS